MSGARSTALVADTEELFSYALTALLKNRLGFSQVVAVSNFKDASRVLAADETITFGAFDVTLADMNGLTDVANLRVAYPELRLAVIAQSSRRDDILRALSAGIHGYIPRTLDLAEVVNALEFINTGHIYVPSALSDITGNRGQSLSGYTSDTDADIPGPGHATARLTARQLEIINLIAEGKSNKQIARQLHLSEGTVKAHISAVFKVLDVHDRASVAAFASRG
jgi:DNA-binding NarL/FixJ family response regulator